MLEDDKGGFFVALVIAEFFQICGLYMETPQTLSELIPYLLTVVVGVALVSGVFAVIGRLVNLLLDFTRWR